MGIEGREGVGDVRHPHLSPGYEHGVADPDAALPVEAPQTDDKPARKPRAAAKKADA